MEDILMPYLVVIMSHKLLVEVKALLQFQVIKIIWKHGLWKDKDYIMIQNHYKMNHKSHIRL